jgi:4a-hydroxytetrahydrobiopterin dehydratase
MTVPEPLPPDEVARRLAAMPGWRGDIREISKTFAHTYHAIIHLITYVAAKAQEVSHHPDMDVRWQRITFRITTHDAGNRVTERDFEFARHIDQIAERNGATPVEE